MDLLKERIVKDGQVFEGNILKVDSFLNHRIDMRFLKEVGKEFHRIFGSENVNKIVTIEASGIAVGCVTAQEFDCPLVFAKKSKTKNIAGDVYKSIVQSYTHETVSEIFVSKDFLGPSDRILLVDDFLARGNAILGLIDLIHQSGATLVGCGIVIEKGFQEGGNRLREKGIRLESLAVVDKMDSATGEIIFREEKVKSIANM